MSRAASPPPGPSAGQIQTRLNMRRVMIAWFFGAGWVALTAGAPIIRFGEEIGLKKGAWGLLSALPFIAAFFQILSSVWVERTRRRKPLFLIGNLTQRLLWVVIGLSPFVLLDQWRQAAVVATLGLFLAQAIGGSITGPAWVSWMADVVPPRLRARYFGVRNQIGLVVIVALSLLCGWLLEGARVGALSVPWPRGLADWTVRAVPFALPTWQLCSVFFVVAGVLGTIDILYFAKVPDIPAFRPARPPGLGDIFGPPLRDRSFVNLLLFIGAFYIGAPGVGNYIWLYALNDLGIPELKAQLLLMVGPSVGALVFAGLWGRLIERFGRKTVYVIAAGVPAVLPCCWIAIGPGYWQVAFIIPFLGGLFWNGIEQLNFNSLLHYTHGRQCGSGYQAVFALVIALAGTASGLLFGGLATLLTRPAVRQAIGPHVNYMHVLFAVSSIILVVSYATLLRRLHDDRRREVGADAAAGAASPVQEAIRYIYDSISHPLRALGREARPADPDDGDFPE